MVKKFEIKNVLELAQNITHINIFETLERLKGRIFRGNRNGFYTIFFSKFHINSTNFVEFARIY